MVLNVCVCVSCRSEEAKALCLVLNVLATREALSLVAQAARAVEAGRTRTQGALAAVPRSNKRKQPEPSTASTAAVGRTCMDGAATALVLEHGGGAAVRRTR